MLLAYALVSVIIFQHNSHRKINTKVVLRPIEAGQFSHDQGLRPIEAGQFSHDQGVRQNPVGIISKVNECSIECDQCEIDLSDKEIDLEMTTTVYLASVKKLVILNTLQSTISRIMLNTISLFKPFQPGLSDGSSVSPRAAVTMFMTK